MNDSVYLILSLGPFLHTLFIFINIFLNFKKDLIWKSFTLIHGISTVSVAIVMFIVLFNKNPYGEREANFILEAPNLFYGALQFNINRFSFIMVFFLNLIFFLNQFLLIQRKELTRSELSSWSALSVSLTGALFGSNISTFIFSLALMILSLVIIFGTDKFKDKEKFLTCVVSKGILAILILVFVNLISHSSNQTNFSYFLDSPINLKEAIKLYGTLLSFWLISGLPPFHLGLSLGLRANNYERNLTNIAPAIFSIILITFHLSKESILLERMREPIFWIFTLTLSFSVFDLIRRHKISEYGFRGLYVWLLSWIMLGIFSGQPEGISGGLVLSIIMPIILGLSVGVGLILSQYEDYRKKADENSFGYISDVAFILTKASTLFAPVSVGCLSLFMILTSVKNGHSKILLFLLAVILSLSILATAKNFLINPEYSEEYSLYKRLRIINGNQIIFLLPLIIGLVFSIILPTIFLNAGFEGYLLFFR